MAGKEVKNTYYRGPPLLIILFNIAIVWTFLPILAFTNSDYIIDNILSFPSLKVVLSNYQSILRGIFIFIFVLHGLEALLVWIICHRRNMETFVKIRWTFGVFINGITQLIYLLIDDHGDTSKKHS